MSQHDVQKAVNILAIETSCDETSVAIVRNGREVLVNLVSSQIETHRQYGGVVPEVASRKHVEVISEILAEAFAQAGVRLSELDAIAVTHGPGALGFVADRHGRCENAGHGNGQAAHWCAPYRRSYLCQSN